MFYVEAPTVEPYRFGLLSVSDVIDSNDSNWQAEGVQYQPLCGGWNTAVQPVDVVSFTLTGGGTTGVDPNFTYPVDLTTDGTVSVDWGDGTVESVTDTGTHSYTATGTFTVTATKGDAVSTAQITVPTTGTVTSVPQDKELLAEPGLITGAPVTVYAMAGCKMVGDFPKAQERAMGNLALGEQQALEEGVMRRVLSGATVINSGDTLSPKQGLAALEGYASTVYGGSPTMHMSRLAGSLLGADGLKANGGHLESILGSKVAAGGGYMLNIGPDGTDAPAGQAWMYATGTVVVRRASAQSYGPVPNLSSPDNSYVALAERTYVVTADCFKAAVLVTTF